MAIDIKEIPEHQGYGASADGRIWSRRNGKWGLSDRWRELRCVANNVYGRKIVHLGRGTPHYVHHLILHTFVGERQQGHEARHIDGDASNNSVNNLQWGTRDENLADMRKHGRKKGEKHHQTSLTDNDVRTIRARAESGESSISIARDYPINDRAVRKIVSRERWQHI